MKKRKERLLGPLSRLQLERRIENAMKQYALNWRSHTHVPKNTKARKRPIWYNLDLPYMQVKTGKLHEEALHGVLQNQENVLYGDAPTDVEDELIKTLDLHTLQQSLTREESEVAQLHLMMRHDVSNTARLMGISTSTVKRIVEKIKTLGKEGIPMNTEKTKENTGFVRPRQTHSLDKIITTKLDKIKPCPHSGHYPKGKQPMFGDGKWFKGEPILVNGVPRLAALKLGLRRYHLHQQGSSDWRTFVTPEARAYHHAVQLLRMEAGRNGDNHPNQGPRRSPRPSYEALAHMRKAA